MSRIENRVISRIYTNSHGTHKERVRQRVNNFILNSGIDNPLILTLPGANWVWERSLLALDPSAKFIGVESNPKISKQAVLNSIDIISSVTVYNELLVTILHQCPSNAFSHIIMDYCCTINSVMNEIEYTLKNDLVMKNGIISITLSKMNIQPRTLIGSINDILPANVLGFKGSASTVATKLLMSHLIINNPRYQMIDIIEYNDTSAMILFIIKRKS